MPAITATDNKGLLEIASVGDQRSTNSGFSILTDQSGSSFQVARHVILQHKRTLRWYAPIIMAVADWPSRKARSTLRYTSRKQGGPAGWADDHCIGTTVRQLY